MRVAFLGTGEFAVPALRALHAAGHTLTVVISQPDRPTGRGLSVRPTPVHATADALGLPHVQTADVNATDAGALLGGAELGFVAAFGQKIGAGVLPSPRCGCVNLHGSLLPRYRGAAPYQWAIINGDAETGVTIFQIDERWDAGPIWSRRATPIGELETADELHDRLALIGAELAVETVAALARGDLTPQPQDATQASRAPKLSKADSAIDWTTDAQRLACRIRGLWSWPAASCTCRTAAGRAERLQIARAAVADADVSPDAQAVPGTFRADLSVQTGRGTLRLIDVKPSGGVLMSFDAFARGRRIAAGDRLTALETT